MEKNGFIKYVFIIIIYIYQRSSDYHLPEIKYLYIIIYNVNIILLLEFELHFNTVLYSMEDAFFKENVPGKYSKWTLEDTDTRKGYDDSEADGNNIEENDDDIDQIETAEDIQKANQNVEWMNMEGLTDMEKYLILGSPLNIKD